MSLNLHVIGDHSSIYSCSAGTNSSSKLVSKGVQSEEDEVKSNFKLANSSFNAGATHTVPKLSPLFIPLPPLTTTEAAPRSGRSDLLSSCRKKNRPERKARMNHSDLISLAPIVDTQADGKNCSTGKRMHLCLSYLPNKFRCACSGCFSSRCCLLRGRTSSRRCRLKCRCPHSYNLISSCEQKM